MDKALNELKVRAKRLFKLCKNDDPKALARLAKGYKSNPPTAGKLQLKHCQVVIANELGFADWQSLHTIFSAKAGHSGAGLDMGTLFYKSACSAFLNQWFTTYDEAKTALDAEHYLLPYKKQFVLVTAQHIETLGIFDTTLLHNVHKDIVSCYPSSTWDDLALQVLKNFD